MFTLSQYSESNNQHNRMYTDRRHKALIVSKYFGSLSKHSIATTKKYNKNKFAQ